MATEARPRPRLQRRLLGWLLAYIALLTLVLAVAGLALHEHAERTVWRSLLHAEMNRYLQRSAEEPGYRWRDGKDLHLYRWREHAPPRALQGLAPGLHDDVWIDGRLCVVLVQDSAQGRLALALDETEFEGVEAAVGLRTLAVMLAVVLALGVLLAYGINRIVRPLATLAGAVARLRPGRSGQRIQTAPRDSQELQVIADAFNGYLQRSEQYVERERAFIDSASHELRTPIAAIAGAAQLAVQQEGLPPAAREQLQRVLHGSHQTEQLIALLLVLAKDPKRLAASAERIALHELLREVVEDHRPLTRDRQLQLQLEIPAACELVAPQAIVHVAIGNLLRNAIEHSDGGVIRVRLDADASVTIADPGHGMAAEEVARLYARLARGEGRDGGGIGLALIARLCEHLGWRLDIDADADAGTVARLHFRPSSVAVMN